MGMTGRKDGRIELHVFLTREALMGKVAELGACDWDVVTITENWLENGQDW